LIRHAFLAVATAIPLLPVAVIQPPLDAALMTAVGGAALPQARLLTALLAAITLAPVATSADREQRSTLRMSAKSRSENNFRMNRHRSATTAFDKDNSS
jgi:hypothetical protein